MNAYPSRKASLDYLIDKFIYAARDDADIQGTACTHENPHTHAH